ncbi:hypothetical protein C8N25_14811 [Algoriphagus antarcticus]|uniref:Uncharacterized protein n=1 Tax=Algoriphagus antarcticus TaxID=238540 RepID=A0A3E0D4T8_9BACT|nr:hypothetical protein C8N25_14811 [Algoriphagus antarcticus]
MNELIKQFAELTIEKESDPFNYRKVISYFIKDMKYSKSLKMIALSLI